jgi:hypothetical protein
LTGRSRQLRCWTRDRRKRHEILSQQTRKNENAVTRTALNAATKPLYL